MTTADQAPTPSGQNPGLRAAKNTALLVTMRVVAPAMAVVVMLALARILGARGVGQYTLAFTLLTLFSTVVPLGLYPVITREGARDPSRLSSILRSSMLLGLGSSLIGTVTMGSLAQLLGYDADTTRAIWIISLALVPFTLCRFMEGALVALERIDVMVVATASEYALKVGVGVLLLLRGYGLESVLVMAVIGKPGGIHAAFLSLIWVGFLATVCAFARASARRRRAQWRLLEERDHSAGRCPWGKLSSCTPVEPNQVPRFSWGGVRRYR